MRSVPATIAAGVLVVMSAICGVLISLHHRKLEVRKFTHIVNCEEFLGLHRDDLLPPGTVRLPMEIRLLDVFRPRIRNTSVFILRMHVSILLFALVFVLARLRMGFPR